MCNKILTNGKIPDAWRFSFLVPIYKYKGDIQICANYRGMKLTAHTLVKNHMRQFITHLRHNEKTMWFCPDSTITDAIQAVRIVGEKY